MIFTAILCLLVGILLGLTFDLGPVSRLVPSSVVVPTFALLVLRLMLDLFPRWAKTDRQQDNKPFDVGKTGAPHARRTWSVSCWVALPVGLIYLFGFVVGAPMFTALYLKGRARQTWTLALGASAVTWALVHGVFVTLLGARLHDGWMW